MTTAVLTVTPCPSGFQDHIYKVAHGVEVPLRIWPSPNPGPAPWLFWAHGGGFVAGKHAIPNAWVVPAFQKYGYHVVSIGYRFMPHVAFEDIIDDCKDAYAWCRAELPGLLDGIQIDQVVVAGDSAGGTISTVCGAVFDPRPKAVIDVFGVVDFNDPYMHKSGRSGSPGGRWRIEDDDEIKKYLSDRDPSKAEVICPWDWELEPNMSVKDLQSFWGMPDYTPQEKDFIRMDMKKYMGESGTMLATLFRRDAIGEEVYERKLSQWNSVGMVDGKYPPTFILHGTADSAVPVEQSRLFEKKCKEVGIPVDARYCEGGEHCFENKIEVSLAERLARDYCDRGADEQSPDQPEWDEYITPCMEFVDKYVRA